MLSLLASIALASVMAEPDDGADSDCTWSRATPASIQAVMSDPSRYRGKCVEVRAITNGYLLFTSVEGYYRSGPLVGGEPEANPNDRERLGIYNSELLERTPAGELRHVTAVGTLRDCEADREAAYADAAPNEIIWISGFCHYADGPYLWLDHVEVGPLVDAARLTGEDMRSKVGNLFFAPADWPYRKFAEEKAREYLGVLRRGDRSAFSKMHLETERPPQLRNSVSLAFGSHPGFTKLRRTGREPQMAILVQREEPRIEPQGVETLHGPRSEFDEYSATICFCILPDCTALWPISWFDADNRDDRPYVCTELQPFVVYRQGTVPAFSTQRGRHGLPEPNR